MVCVCVYRYQRCCDVVRVCVCCEHQWGWMTRMVVRYRDIASDNDDGSGRSCCREQLW